MKKWVDIFQHESSHYLLVFLVLVIWFLGITGFLAFTDLGRTAWFLYLGWGILILGFGCDGFVRRPKK